MKTRVELVTEARAEAVRRLPMLDEGQSYKAGYEAGFVQAADWLSRQQKLQQTSVMRADQAEPATPPSYCSCGAKIPEDDPYDGYCTDCG